MCNSGTQRSVSVGSHLMSRGSTPSSENGVTAPLGIRNFTCKTLEGCWEGPVYCFRNNSNTYSVPLLKFAWVLVFLPSWSRLQNAVKTPVHMDWKLAVKSLTNFSVHFYMREPGFALRHRWVFLQRRIESFLGIIWIAGTTLEKKVTSNDYWATFCRLRPHYIIWYRLLNLKCLVSPLLRPRQVHTTANSPLICRVHRQLTPKSPKVSFFSFSFPKTYFSSN